MHILFLLPNVSLNQVIGEYRVHYEYANRLARRGYSISIVHWGVVDPNIALKQNQDCNTPYTSLKDAITWFDFEAEIQILGINQEEILPARDILICTAWQTAMYFGESSPPCQISAQIAYDYEFWKMADEEVRKKMAKAFHQTDLVISTSNAVAQMLEECGRVVDTNISCGIDKQIFGLRASMSSRGNTIGILLRDHVSKRLSDALEALSLVRKQHDITVLAAGTWSQPLPSWVIQVETVTDQQLNLFYNQLSIFLLPSEYEGWGLPAMEAMAAGACVISAKNGGVENFIEHGISGLLYEPRNIMQLQDCICRLLDMPNMRQRLARNGQNTASEFSWESSVGALENLLNNAMRTRSLSSFN